MRVGKNCYTVKIFLFFCTKVLGMRQTHRGIMTQAWHSDCASMGRQSDLCLSHGRMFPFHQLLSLSLLPFTVLRKLKLPRSILFFFISNLFPTLSVFQGHNVALISPLPPEQQKLHYKAAANWRSALVELFLSLKLGLEQVLLPISSLSCPVTGLRQQDEAEAGEI